MWNPGNLLIRREWFKDGPFLSVEFVRQSKDGRLTLVIHDKAKPVRTLWALMATEDLEEAKTSLAIREGIREEKIEKDIGSIEISKNYEDQNSSRIQEWAKSLKLDAVIWTNLKPRFNKIDGCAPSLSEALQYLNDLDINIKELSENYIRRTPKQIDTDYRREFEKKFGWSYIS